MSETIMDKNHVAIFDTTLRDGEQSPGISLDIQQKLDIAQQLGRLGVDIIEAGFPILSEGEFSAVQNIAREVEGPVICGLARANSSDIFAAWKAIKDSERPRIHTFISTSDIHIDHQLKSTRDNVKGQVRAAVNQAKSYCEDVEFSPMDATRAELEFTAEVCEIAVNEGATVINIPDTVGYTTPEEYSQYFSMLYEYVPMLDKVQTSVHCHDDLGLAVANSYAGVLAGARQVECAINGIGERAGNCSLEEIAMLLKTRHALHGLHTGIDTTLLGPTSRMVSRYTGYLVQLNKAVVGENAFKHESGIHQDGVIKERTTYEIMSAIEVGMNPDSIVLGKHSGRKAVEEKLSAEGVYKPDYLNYTFELFKEAADRIGKITIVDLVALHEEAYRRATNKYKLGEDFNVESSGHGFSARVRVIDKDTSVSKNIHTSENHPKLDGPVHALFKAIKEATQTEFLLHDYSTNSLGEGEEALGEARVSLRVGNNIISGKGVSTDLLKASGWAYLHAISLAHQLANDGP